MNLSGKVKGTFWDLINILKGGPLNSELDTVHVALMYEFFR